MVSALTGRAIVTPSSCNSTRNGVAGVTLDVEAGQVVREHRPQTACLTCTDCGSLWSEDERKAALHALEHAPDYGWRQTKPFVCCEERQTPEAWNAAGRSLCIHCGEPSPYQGHAGFHASKLYSIRHKLAALATEFLNAKGSPELLKKFTNTGLAEQWEPRGSTVDASSFAARAETYGPDDLPEPVQAVTGFCDVQGDRLEVQLVGWGPDEEAWPFVYEVIREDPAQPAAWIELDALIAREFKTRDGRVLRAGAFGVDTGGNHTAQVHSYCRRRAKRRIFACKGMSGSKPLWPTNAIRSKSNDHLWMLGVDTGKEAIYGRLRIAEPGPGYIHFPADDAFGEHYFQMLTAERREVRKRAGQSYTVWVPIRERNEALDTFVGALAVRRSLPRRIERGLEFAVAKPEAATPPAGRRILDIADRRHAIDAHGRADAEPGLPRRTPDGRPKRRSDFWGNIGRKSWL